DDGELAEAMEIIHTARDVAGKQKVEIDKSKLKAAKKLPKKTEEEKEIRKQQIAQAKAEIKKSAEFNEAVECMVIVNEELDKFSTERFQKQLEQAKETVNNGALYCYDDFKAELKNAKQLPKSTKEEKQIRSDAIELARTKKTASKLIMKYTIDAIKAPDDAVEEEIRSRETASMSDAFKQKRQLKAYLKSVSIYKRATAPYENAKNLIIQAENYTHLGEIEQLYQSKTVSAE
ncbi:MAG: hypothetical protein ACI4GY_09945, partial [Acutalibacteraceae bacterium]